MRVERVGPDKVKERIAMLKRKADEMKSGVIQTNRPSAIEEYDNKLAERELQMEMEKRRKKDDLIAKKKEQEAIEFERIDPDIAEMMGFGGFSTKKR